MEIQRLDKPHDFAHDTDGNLFNPVATFDHTGEVFSHLVVNANRYAYIAPIFERDAAGKQIPVRNADGNVLYLEQGHIPAEVTQAVVDLDPVPDREIAKQRRAKETPAEEVKAPPAQDPPPSKPEPNPEKNVGSGTTIVASNPPGAKIADPVKAAATDTEEAHSGLQTDVGSAETKTQD